MTYIEFFDKNVVENICTSLVKPPERVILIGDKGSVLEKHAARYRRLLQTRGHQVEFLWRSVNKNNMGSILSVLSELVETYDNCLFDLTGGDELYLVAVGVISQMYRDKNIQMHRVNVRNGSITDCDQDGVTLQENPRLTLSVEENIRLYGGDIVYEDIKPGGTYRWEMTNEFHVDIATMWEICRENVRQWNGQINVLAAAETAGTRSPDGLTVTAHASALRSVLKRREEDDMLVWRIMEGLYEWGLITQYSWDEETLCVQYKNEQVKRCLVKAGQALEMRIYQACLLARDKEGNYIYDDVMNGVRIDWDGKIQESGGFDTENEIDVMLTHGIVPVFVSCKNGQVTMEELYKLNTVAERFGGKYAKKVLVATALEAENTSDEYFRQRAKDMNIRIVEGVQEKTGQELTKLVSGFWHN